MPRREYDNLDGFTLDKILSGEVCPCCFAIIEDGQDCDCGATMNGTYNVELEGIGENNYKVTLFGDWYTSRSGEDLEEWNVHLNQVFKDGEEVKLSPEQEGALEKFCEIFFTDRICDAIHQSVSNRLNDPPDD